MLEGQGEVAVAASLIDQGIDHIRELIATGTLHPGSRLPAEQELATMLGCSRNTAREVVRALVMARVVDVRRGDGTYVTSLEPKLLLEGIGFAVDLMQEDSLLELWELRRVLEATVTAKAAERISAEELAELTEIFERMRETTDDPELVAQDARFHEVIAQAAGNRTLASILSNLSSRTMRSRVWRAAREANATSITVSQHAEILAALRAKDREMAYAAAILHIGTSESWFRAISREARELRPE